MVKLTIEQVRHVARLARLTLTAEEELRYARQLSAILDHAEQLGEVDTSGVEPTAHALGFSETLREDEVRPSLDPAKALANAPATSGTAVAVPKIIE